MRPTVQVGDPFLEKVLIEACLEAAASGCLEADAGPGRRRTDEFGDGSARRAAGTGVEIDVAKAPRREEGMTPYEVMLSESQERMLLLVKQGREEEIAALFERWDLSVSAIGAVTGDGHGEDLRRGPSRVGDADRRARRGSALRAPGPASGVPRLVAVGADAAAPAAVRGRPDAAAPSRVAQRRKQAVGVPPVRPRGAERGRLRSRARGMQRCCACGSRRRDLRLRSTATAGSRISTPTRVARWPWRRRAET